MIGVGEVRVPSKLISYVLEEKEIKALRLLICAKLKGHRAIIKHLLEALKIHPKTGKRLIKKIVREGWAGTDGKYIFPRSWNKIGFSKQGGFYLTTLPKNLHKLESLVFAFALKKIYRKRGSQHSKNRRVMQNDFPARYLYLSLGISQRRFERLKASAQRYRFISVKPQYIKIGLASEFDSIRKNLHGVPVFIRGKYTVVPGVSTIKVLI